MSDIEIARNTQLEKITKIAEEMNIQEDQLEQYGKYKAKISPEVYKNLKDKKDKKQQPKLPVLSGDGLAKKLRQLEKQMHKHAENMEFELAAKVRDELLLYKEQLKL